MATNLLTGSFVALSNIGIFDYLIPFILIFAVLYGILQKTMLLGEKNKKLNPVFSVIVSLMMLPFVAGVDYSLFISRFIIVIVGILAINVVAGIFGFKVEKKNNVVLFLICVLLFIIITGFISVDLLNSFISSYPGLFYSIIGIVFFGLVIWYITDSKEVAISVTETSRPMPRTPSPSQNISNRSAQPQQRMTQDDMMNEMINRIPPERRNDFVNSIRGMSPEERNDLFNQFNRQMRSSPPDVMPPDVS